MNILHIPAQYLAMGAAALTAMLFAAASHAQVSLDLSQTRFDDTNTIRFSPRASRSPPP